ncbi:histone-fold-containing protein, partial [Cyathus striatus]
KKKREKREPVELTREPGKSLFPFSRVQKIIKADQDIPIVAKEATYLISLATEEFIKRLCTAAQKVASREQRATVQHKDIATVVRKADEFLFLEDVIPWMASDAAPKRPKPKVTKGDQQKSSGSTFLDQFVTTSKNLEVTDGQDVIMGDGDVIMNEDGTMQVA